MRNTSILLAGVALALAGAATPGFAHTHHRHMASSTGMHHPSTPAERQQTAQLNQQQLAQAQNANAAAGANAGMAANGTGSDNTSVSSNANGTATQQNGLTTEPTSYQRMRGSSGAGPGATAPANTGTAGTAAGSGDNAAGQDQQVGSPMNGNPQGNPGGAVSPPPPANPSGTPQ